MQRCSLMLRGLPPIVLVCSLLATPAQAQFTQQAKLISTGFVGSPVLQGYLLRFPVTGIPPSWAGKTITAV